MQAKCIICDQVDELDNDSVRAKRLRRRYITLCLCHECHGRITHKTNERHETGKFNLFKSNDKKDFI